jgi:NADPH-dependent dioxygenase
MILVVGAGPVGLTAAHELRRRDVPVRIVDARPDARTTSRAIATHPRTLEVYDQMGVIDEMLARGNRIGAFTLFHNGRRLIRLDADYASMPTRFPFTLCIDQVVTEDVLRNALAAQGVKVEWGTKLTDLHQDADRVRATLVHGDGTEETAEVDWLVGADGGHSTVRRLLDLPLIGATNQTWLLADGQVDVDLPRNSIYWIRAEGATLMAVPFIEPGRWRLLDTVDVSQDDDPAAIAARFSRKLTAGLGRPVVVAPPDWVSVFTAQQRLVPRMRVGRVLVAGDAAHVHSPASGQGMNTGIQEAVNLAWKLAMVYAGQAGDALLDTYSAERVPLGEALLSSTERATRLVALRTAAMERLLPVALGVVRRVPALRRRIQRKILGNVSGLRVAYPDSPLTAAGGGGRLATVDGLGAASEPWPTLLAELRRPGWLLIAAASAASAASARSAPAMTAVDLPRFAGRPWLRVVPVSPGAGGLGLGPGEWLLVRPDGYLAARGGPGESAGELLDRLVPVHGKNREDK